MALSVFADALPYTEISKNYSQWFSSIQISPLLANVGYSSSLHWQLYCNKYPDERGVFVDWNPGIETNKKVIWTSKALRFLDNCGDLGIYTKKVLDRVLFRGNYFANIPFRFRPFFTEQGKYLFWNKATYSQESLFNNYNVVSQDEGHISFDAAIERLNIVIESGDKNIFFCTGFADALGHVCKRGERYSEKLQPYMHRLHDSIARYIELHPEEPVIIVSDHGMSTIKKKVDLELDTRFGKQSKGSYIAYSDSAIMCVWCYDKSMSHAIADYLMTREEGHLLTESERIKYGITSQKFGNLIYILKEGNVFENNWFGKSVKKPSPDGEGMHGFWPSLDAKDQLATIILINSKRVLDELYDYPKVHDLLNDIMIQ